MSDWGTGLTRVNTKDLKLLLKLIYKEELEFPLTTLEFARGRLSHIVGDVDLLRGLDAKSTQALLVAVIAERNKFEVDEA